VRTASRFRFGQTVIRQRAGAAPNPYTGLEARTDWDNPDAITITDAAIAPTGSASEETETRRAVTSAFTLFAPYSADIAPGDRIVADGVTWIVGEDIHRWRNPHSGRTPGLTAAITRVQG
jgi:hypothetical protein